MNFNDDLSVHTELKTTLPIKEIKEVSDPERDSWDFGESACGEPLESQHLVVDFTPNDEDTDFVQKKCCAFWDFITSCPELENVIVQPMEKYSSDGKSRSSDIELSPIKSIDHQKEAVKTAVSMIEFVEEKGLITRAFEAKLPQLGCSIGSMDYFEEKSAFPHVVEKNKICNCKKVCKTCNVKSTLEQQQKISSEGVEEMCKEFKDWDAVHPKSMDPPGHSPSLDLL